MSLKLLITINDLNLLVSTCEEYMTKEFQTWTELSHDTSKEQ